MKALIIGFGHIGQRHFESIYNYKKLKEIYVYDKEIKKVQEYLKLNKKYKKKLKILDNFSKDKSFFLCIISTNSDVRFEMFKKINNTMRIKNYIFEKIVFQKPTEYEKTYKIIIKNKLNCWINCPRRGWKIYTDIKKKIIKNKKFVMKISGENWGLLSNSIHFKFYLQPKGPRKNFD